jgi:DNA polymerase
VKTLGQIKADWASCNKCPLATGDRKQVCFSDGPEDAKIMLIGEGPGKTENDTGIPFTGPAGQLMTKILALVGIKRQDVYWTNVVRCHPPFNRTPLQPEMLACQPLLLTEIEMIRPKVIILAGATPVKSLLKSNAPMSQSAGKWFSIMGIPTIAIYHPAAVLHTQEKDPEVCQQYKNSIWKAVKEVRELLSGKTKAPEPSIKAFAQKELF